MRNLRRIVFALFALIASVGLPISPAAAEKFKMRLYEEIRNERVRDFIRRLHENLRIAYPDLVQDWEVEGFGVGEIDLNGDGVPELLVGYGSTFFTYGNSGKSMVSVYRRQDDWWVYVGQISGASSPPGVQIEDKTYNGWKIIRYGKFYSCWTDVRVDGLERDIFLSPYNPASEGYRGGTGKGKPCP